MSRPNNQPLPRLGFVLLAAITLFWGVNFPAMKLVLAEVSPWTFRAGCLFPAGVGLLIIARLGGHRIAIPRSDWRPLILAAVFNITGWHLFSAFALAVMEASRAVIIAYTMPLWSWIVAWLLLGERPTLRRLAGLIVGLLGLAVLIWPQWETIKVAPLGAALILASAWCWALGTVFIKRGPWHMPLSLITGWMFLLGGLPIFVGALIFDSPAALVQVSGQAWLIWAYVVLVPMLFCHWAYYKVVSLFPVYLASIGVLLTPALSVVTSLLTLGERLAWTDWTALALVLLALALVMFNGRRAGQETD